MVSAEEFCKCRIFVVIYGLGYNSASVVLQNELCVVLNDKD